MHIAEGGLVLTRETTSAPGFCQHGHHACILPRGTGLKIGTLRVHESTNSNKSLPHPTL